MRNRTTVAAAADRGTEHQLTGAERAGYSRDIILGRANALATKRYRVSVSDDQLDRWVYKRLIPGPTPRGRQRGMPPDWLWSALSYRRLLQICRLRKHGVTRTTAVVAHLWFGGADYPFSLVRNAVRSEFRRLRKGMARSVPASWDPRVDGVDLPPRSREAVLRGLGQRDAAFPDLSPDAVLWLSAAMMFALEPGDDLMFGALSDFGVPASLMSEWRQQDAAVQEMGLAKGVLAGLAADPDDTDRAAELALASADEETFVNLRDFCRMAPWMYRLIPAVTSLVCAAPGGVSFPPTGLFARFSSVLNQFWFRLLHFVLMARRAQLKGDHGRGAGALAQRLLSPFHRLILSITANAQRKALLEELVKGLGIRPDASLSALFSVLVEKQKDPAVQAAARKLIRATWHCGMAELLQLRKLKEGTE